MGEARAAAPPATRPRPVLRLPAKPKVLPKSSLSVARTPVFTPAPAPAPAAADGQGPSAIARLIATANFVPPARAARAIGPEVPAGPDLPEEAGRAARAAAHRSRVRPVRPGVSIGHWAVTAGTLGAVVWDQATGEPLLLSNNHVLANATTGRDGRARKGDPILQPGPADGTPGGPARVRRPAKAPEDHPDMVARLGRYVPLRLRGANLVDAATAVPVSPDVVSPEAVGLGRAVATAPARPGIVVRKSGRTTGVTEAEVYAIHASVRVEYPHGTLAFVDQIVCGPMSEPGDSGALVVDPAGRAVGMVFAGSERATLCNPIGRVLRALAVSLTAPGEEPPVPAPPPAAPAPRPAVLAAPGPLAARALAVLARD